MSEIQSQLALIRLLYSYEAARELELLAESDPQGAAEIIQAALHPDALKMKHAIDKSERSVRAADLK